MFKFNLGDTVYYRMTSFVTGEPCKCCGATKQKETSVIKSGVVIAQYLTKTDIGESISYAVKNSPDSTGYQSTFSHNEKELMSKEDIDKDFNIWWEVKDV